MQTRNNFVVNSSSFPPISSDFSDGDVCLLPFSWDRVRLLLTTWLSWPEHQSSGTGFLFFFCFLIPGFPVRWEELVVSWNCQSWSRILCIGNVYQRVVELQLGHWSIQWIDILHNQHFWFTSLSRKLLIPHRHIDAWHSVSYFSVVLWPSFVTSFRMSSKTLLLPVWCDILWFPRNGTKLCGHQSTFFVQWSLTCDYYPYDFVAQLPKGCWNFIWPGVLSHKSGRYPDHVKAWIQWCLA